MFIGSLVIVGVAILSVILLLRHIFSEGYSLVIKVVSVIITIAIIIGLLFELQWEYNNTIQGQRALLELNDGVERTITVYKANGEILAQYSGEIDVENNGNNSITFNFNGKNYTYYNCLVEEIVDIDN